MAPYFPLYLSARGFGAVEIASVLALGPFTRIFAPALWAELADRTGARRGIVILSCAALVCGFAALPFATGFAAVVAVMGVTHFVAAGGLPLVETITLSSLRPADSPGAGPGPGGYGRVRAWGSVGFIVAGLAVGAWLDAHPAATLGGVFVLLTTLSLVVSLFVPRGTPAGAAEPAQRAQAARTRAAARIVLAAGFFMIVAHGALYAFLSLHLRRIGYSTGTIGALWALGVVAEIGVFMLLPRLLRRYSLWAVLVASFAAAVLRFVLIGWYSGSVGLLVFAQCLHGLTFGAHHAASVAALQRLFPAGAQARGQALYSSIAYGAGGVAGSLLAGWLWKAAGAGPTYTAAALAALLGGALAWRLRETLS